MKSFNSVSRESAAPSLFQIAAFFEDFFPSPGIEPANRVQVSHLPFADFMLNPEKLMAVLRGAARTADSSVPPPQRGNLLTGADNEPSFGAARNSNSTKRNEPNLSSAKPARKGAVSSKEK